MPTYIPIQNTPIQIQDSTTSVNMSGGSLEFYDAGTTDSQQVFSDDEGTTVGSSVTLNAGGYPESGGNTLTLFRDQSKALKIVCKNSSGAELWTADDIPAVASFDSDSNTKLAGIEEGADVTDAQNVGAVVNGRQEYFVPYGDFYLPTTAPCGAETIVEGTPGMPNYRGYPFDGSTKENIEFIWMPPKRWNLSSVTAEVYFTSADTGTDGVTWAVQAVALRLSSLGNDFAQSYGTPVTVNSLLQGGAGKGLTSSESTNITIANGPTDNDIICFRVYRDVDNVNDTLAADAVLLGVKIYWTSNALNDA